MLALYGLFVALWAATLAIAAPSPKALIHSDYAPADAACPSESLLRPASDGLADAEVAFVKGRKPIADKALADWLNKLTGNITAGTGTSWNGTNGPSANGTSNSTASTSRRSRDHFVTSGHLPTIAFLTSGGGHRSFLTSAGVIQALDERENLSPLGGLWQAMMYHAGNSGGSWLVSALAANQWATISSMISELWSDSLNSGIWGGRFSLTNSLYYDVGKDLLAKKFAGHDVVLTDAYGRLISHQFLIGGSDGQVATKLSDLGTAPDALRNPMPIMVALNVDSDSGSCMAGDQGIHIEITPFEMGSWDDGLAAFTPTKYLGTHLVGGKPSGSCVTGYDNVGYMLGTSSSLFNIGCNPANQVAPPIPIVGDLVRFVEGGVAKQAGFATFPNPFSQSPISGTDPSIAGHDTLYLVDGGLENENNPIWPFLKGERPVDVLFINDNTANTPDNYANGFDLQHTAVKAKAAGLIKMPDIPGPEFFEENNARPTFFGCHSPEQYTIVYVLNKDYTFDSGQSTFKFSYNYEESHGMFTNGNAVATQGGDEDWPMCVACAIMQKSDTPLPSKCTACLDKYCYN